MSRITMTHMKTVEISCFKQQRENHVGRYIPDRFTYIHARRVKPRTRNFAVLRMVNHPESGPWVFSSMKVER